MGQALEQIRGNVAFQMVIQKVQTDAFADFANSAPTDPAQREMAYAYMRGITGVLDAMEHFIQDGAKVSRETPQDPSETGPQESN